VNGQTYNRCAWAAAVFGVGVACLSAASGNTGLHAGLYGLGAYCFALLFGLGFVLLCHAGEER
jgi:hypothetical protein